MGLPAGANRCAAPTRLEKSDDQSPQRASRNGRRSWHGLWPHPATRLSVRVDASHGRAEANHLFSSESRFRPSDLRCQRLGPPRALCPTSRCLSRSPVWNPTKIESISSPDFTVDTPARPTALSSVRWVDTAVASESLPADPRSITSSARSFRKRSCHTCGLEWTHWKT